MNNNNQSKNQKKVSTKQEISLLTLLANESTADSRKLLKKYGKEDSKDYADLEKKLADLYFSSPDKIQLEKEMVQIHPHRAWILKYEIPKLETKKEEPKIEVKAVEEIKVPETVKVSEIKSNAHGDCPQHGANCPYHENEHARMRMSSDSSSFDAQSSLNSFSEKHQLNSNTLVAVLGVLGIVAVLAMTMNKQNK
jgi:hypothetical protein